MPVTVKTLPATSVCRFVHRAANMVNVLRRNSANANWAMAGPLVMLLAHRCDGVKTVRFAAIVITPVVIRFRASVVVDPDMLATNAMKNVHRVNLVSIVLRSVSAKMAALAILPVVNVHVLRATRDRYAMNSAPLVRTV